MGSMAMEHARQTGPLDDNPAWPLPGLTWISVLTRRRGATPLGAQGRQQLAVGPRKKLLTARP